MISRLRIFRLFPLRLSRSEDTLGIQDLLSTLWNDGEVNGLETCGMFNGNIIEKTIISRWSIPLQSLRNSGLVVPLNHMLILIEEELLKVVDMHRQVDNMYGSGPFIVPNSLVSSYPTLKRVRGHPERVWTTVTF